MTVNNDLFVSKLFRQKKKFIINRSSHASFYQILISKMIGEINVNSYHLV